MSTYQNQPSINELSIPERTDACKTVALRLIQQRGNVAEFLDMVEDLVQEEMYEAAQGAMSAIDEFKNNPQLALF